MSGPPGTYGYVDPAAPAAPDDATMQAWHAQYYAQYYGNADPNAAATSYGTQTDPNAGYGYSDYTGGNAGGSGGYAYGTAAPANAYGTATGAYGTAPPGPTDYGSYGTGTGGGADGGYGYGVGGFPGMPPPQKKEVDPVALAEKGKQKKKGTIRAAGGDLWEDQTMADWDPNDFRIFCGDLSNECNDQDLIRAFSKYSSFQRARVVRDKRTGKTKGYGFVSFKDPEDFVKAMKEMQGKYVGNRPIKLRKSAWHERNVDPKALKKAIHGSGIVKTQGGNFAIVSKKA
ncbi:RNA-binding protein 42 [Gonapodya sp. JEL0774]|nr:RNA-binding protein 42 [Gonapodya sp. JEL0774]